MNNLRLITCLCLALILYAGGADGQTFFYDSYAPATQRIGNVTVGAVSLSGTAYRVTFTCLGKTNTSAGYEIGVDAISMTRSGGILEAEEMEVVASSGAAPERRKLFPGDWSGANDLYFPGQAAGHSFSLLVNNDRWIDTNFGTNDGLHARTERELTDNLGGADYELKLAGTNGIQWYAFHQVHYSNYYACATDKYSGAAIRCIVKGKNLRAEAPFRSGARVSVGGYGGGWGGSFTDMKVRIEACYLSELAVSGGVVTPDIVPDTTIRLRGPNGEYSWIAGTNNPVSTFQYFETEPINFWIDENKSYAVSFLISSEPGFGTPSDEMQHPSLYGADVNMYVIWGSSAPDANVITQAAWSVRADVHPTNAITLMERLNVSYPSNGVYTSRIIDTKMDQPVYTYCDWEPVLPVGTAVSLSFRASDLSDMSDAPAWVPVSSTHFRLDDIPGGRYCQFMARLQAPAPDFWLTPRLRDVGVSWVGGTGTVNLTCAFTKGSTGGRYEISVTPYPAGMDSDGDGMNDDWEMWYLGGMGGDWGGAGDDPDNDELTNFQEFWIGTDPGDGESRLCFTGAVAGAGEVFLYWRGGTSATHRLQAASSITGNVSWSTVSLMPVWDEAWGAPLIELRTNGWLYYRLTADR